MDRYEFNLKIEQFKKLIEKKDYEVAAKIADTLDLNRVKTVSLLTTIADVYEVTGQYAKAKEVLEIAFDKSSMGRQIAYKLTALSAKLGQIQDARDYYEEYIEMSPNNPSRYLLEYEIAKAENKELPVLISILEKYIAEDMDEKWTYVLAVLYHKAGMGKKCVDMCDTIILWFNGGKFVKRALDLKMLYVPLTSEQQELLDGKKDDEKAKRMKYTEEAASTVVFTPVKQEEAVGENESFEDAAKKYFEENEEQAEAGEMTAESGEVADEDSVDTDETVEEFVENSEETIEETVEEIFGTSEHIEEEAAEPDRPVFDVELEDNTLEDENSVIREEEETSDESDDNEYNQASEEDIAKSVSDVAENDNLMHTTEIDYQQIRVREIDVNSKYNTINLQAEIAESMAAILGDNYGTDAEKYSGPTKELDAFDTAFYDAITPEKEAKQEPQEEQAAPSKESEYIFYTSTDPINPLYELEGDGQVGFSAPEPKKDDDQLEGQLTIEDILAEYERMNQEKEAAEMVEEETQELVVEEQVEEEAAIEENTEIPVEPVVQEQTEVDENALISAEIESEKRGEIKDEYKEIHDRKIASSVDAAALRAMFEEEETIEEQDEDGFTIKKEDDFPIDDIVIQEAAVGDEGEEVAEAASVEEPQPMVEEEATEPMVVVPVVEEQEPQAVEEPETPSTEEPTAQVEEEPENSSIEESTPQPEEVPETQPMEEPAPQPEEAPEAQPVEEEKTPKKKKGLKIAKDEPTKVDLKKELKSFINKYGALTGLDNDIIKILEKLVKEYDKNLTSKTNNVFVTGKLRSGKTTMARDLIKLVNKIRHRDGRKVAKTNAIILNKKGVRYALSNLENVDVIVEKAGSLTADSVKELISVLNEFTNGMIVVFEDEKSAMEQMLATYPELKEIFTNILSIKEFTLRDWANYAESYVDEKGFTLDDMAILALHAELDRIYANNREIGKDDVEELMDEAMENANRGIGKFFKKLFKKNDEDSKVVIKEEHFY